MRAVRIQDRIAVDGALTEPVWRTAEPATDFLQREPKEGAPASERTEVRVLYDDERLYLGYKLYDSEPQNIIATDRRRDSRMQSDDTIAVLIDTFHDHRNGFLFRTNALGTKFDLLLRSETDLNREWDEEWAAAATITGEGWEAEMAIPWRVLRFPTGTHVWGIDFRREIRRKNEDVYWSNHRQDFRFTQVSQAGHLLGLADLRLGDRFRLKPFVTSGLSDVSVSEHPEDKQLTDVGIEDLKIQLRPGLVLDVTTNTDFSEVAVDTAQVNLTRFSLFFPEQREFFLEGNNNFRFGPGAGRGTPLALLYFSRRIGLDDSDEAIPVDGGAKVTGKLGGLTIGALNVLNGNNEVRRAENFGVLRLQHDVFSRSRIGMLLTNRTGGDTFNRVVGADGNFTFYENLDVSGWLARATDTELVGDRWAGQGLAEWDSDRWTFSADWLRIGPGFKADVGFILRRDIERQSYRVGWKPRPSASWLRQIQLFASLEHIADLSGSLESREESLFVNFRLESGDSLFFDFNDQFERLEEPFEIDPEAVIPEGDYRFRNVRFGARFFNGRAVAGEANAGLGEFFNGTRKSLTLAPTVRIGSRIQASLSYAYNRIDLPAGSFATHLVNGVFSYAFNERWLTDAIVQWSNTSRLLTIFVQLDYIYRPNDDIFVVYEQRNAYGGDFDGRADHRFVVKFTHSFGF